MLAVIELIAEETQLEAEFEEWLWGSATIWLAKKAEEPGMALPEGEWWRREKDSASD